MNAAAAGGVLALALVLACAPPAATTPAPCAPAPLAAVPAPAGSRHEVAVLPIEDDGLFRDERAALRDALFASLRERGPELDFVPLEDVDRGLAPVSGSGARCAFDETPLERRARQKGWAHTELVRVLGVDDAPEALWVQIHRRKDVVTYVAHPNRDLEPMARYRQAFSSLQRGDGILDLLAVMGRGSEQHAQIVGTVTLCEVTGFGACKQESKAWGDRAAAIAACYPGEDEASDELLIEGGAAPRCELSQLDDRESRRAAREGCLCEAALGSAAIGAGGRRNLRVRHLAVDLVGRARPALRLLDVTDNMHTVEDYALDHSVRRLVVDNLDALATPLARCEPAAAPLVAELSLSETGNVEKVELRSPVAAPQAACVTAALRRGRFACTSNGKPAVLRLVADWASE